MTAEAPPDGGELGARSLVDLVVTRVRADILRGAFAPGERLVEEQLTRRFGTSRAPLREALRLLGQQGLVEHLPRRGVRVTELSARDLDELFGLRDALERFALQTALDDGPPAPDRLAALERAVVGIECAGESAEGRAVAHRESHLALVGLAGHRHLLRVYEPAVPEWRSCWSRPTPGRPPSSAPSSATRAGPPRAGRPRPGRGRPTGGGSWPHTSARQVRSALVSSFPCHRAD